VLAVVASVSLILVNYDSSSMAHVSLKSTFLCVLNGNFQIYPSLSSVCFCGLSDIDECEINPKVCGSKGQCVNSAGSYHCLCKKGFVSRGSECEGILFQHIFQHFHCGCVLPGLRFEVK